MAPKAVPFGAMKEDVSESKQRRGIRFFWTPAIVGGCGVSPSIRVAKNLIGVALHLSVCLNRGFAEFCSAITEKQGK